MEEQYWHHFGLTQSPFDVDQEEASYFPIKGWEQRMELLTHLCQFSQVLLVIAGEAGCGKSTFNRQFINAMRSTDTIICEMIGSDILTPSQLWQQLSEYLDLNQTDVETTKLSTQINQVATALSSLQQPHLLVIDDAHLLPTKTLSALLQLIAMQTDLKNRLRVLLIGSPMLSERLDVLAQESQSESLIHTMVFEPFTLAQTKRYLEFCFKQVGCQDTLPIPDTQIARIYRDSQGNPRLINDMTEEWMVTVSNQQHVLAAQSSLLSRRNKQLLIVGLLVFITGVIFLVTPLLQRKIQLTDVSRQTNDDQKIQALVNVDDKQATTIPLPAQTRLSDATSTSTAKQVKIMETVAIASPATTDFLEKIVNQAVKQPTVNKVASKITKPISPVIAKQKTPTTQHKTVKQAQTAASAKRLSRQQAEAILASINHDADIDDDFLNGDLASSMAVEQQQIDNAKQDRIVATKPSTASNKAVQPVVIVHPRADRQKKVTELAEKQHSNQQQHTTQYTLQLVGLGSEQAAAQFIKQYRLQQARIVHVRSHQQQFYVVLIGDYPSKVAAKQALITMPLIIQQLKPWIRTLASVQQATLSDADAAPQQAKQTKMISGNVAHANTLF